MELQNSAQGKKFATNSTIVEHRGTVGTFYLPPNRTEKSFAASKSVTGSQIAPDKFNSGSGAIVAEPNGGANKVAWLGSSDAVDLHSTHDAQRVVSTRDYPEQRQFKEQGKSQESLDRQNPPLTIDQVRELLNKNK